MSYELYHGDCLDILPTLAPQSVDAVICDIPSGRTACAWDIVIPFEPMWEQLKRVTKPRGAIVLLGCTQPFTSALVMSNVKMFRYDWVWVKQKGANFGSAGRAPMNEHESILLFSHGRYTFNPQMQQRAPAGLARTKYAITLYGGSDIYTEDRKGKRGVLREMRVPSSVQRFNTDAGLHPTQKPLALLEYLVKTYTNPGDTVLDFCYGSGTAGAACGNLDRRFVGIEKDKAYYDLGSERIATAYAPLRMMEAAV